AQCRDPDGDERAPPAPGSAGGGVPHRALLRHPGHRPRSDPRGRAQRFPDHQGGDDLRRGGDDGDQPARRPALQGDRPARGAQMREQGVWALAWKRFRRDRLGFASLFVVLVYVAIMLGAAAGWLGRDWNVEAGVSFAPPTFLGPEAVESPQLVKAAEGAQTVADYGITDPLAP